MQSVEAFARGVKTESGSNLLLGDGCLFLIASFVHWIIDPFFHCFNDSIFNDSMAQFFK